MQSTGLEYTSVVWTGKSATVSQQDELDMLSC